MRIYWKIVLMVGLLTQSCNLFAAAAADEEDTGVGHPLVLNLGRLIKIQGDHKYFDSRGKHIPYLDDRAKRKGRAGISSVAGIMQDDSEEEIQWDKRVDFAWDNNKHRYTQLYNPRGFDSFGVVSGSFNKWENAEVQATKVDYREYKANLSIDSGWFRGLAQTYEKIKICGWVIEWDATKYPAQTSYFEVMIDLAQKDFSAGAFAFIDREKLPVPNSQFTGSIKF